MSTSKISKKMAFILRHKPESFGVTLDDEGWAEMRQFSAAVKESPDVIYWIVTTCPKNRFELSPDGQRIRARQGHSIPVDLDLSIMRPPVVLCHGTARTNVDSIRTRGISRMSREFVHLSHSMNTAVSVANRRSPGCVLFIRTHEMYARGYDFFRSSNGVWLTRHVPPEFITF